MCVCRVYRAYRVCVTFASCSLAQDYAILTRTYFDADSYNFFPVQHGRAILRYVGTGVAAGTAKIVEVAEKIFPPAGPLFGERPRDGVCWWCLALTAFFVR